MKIYNWIGLVAIACITCFGTGCSNDFEVSEPKVETPVVYAVVDPGIENQYFRVERVFQAEGENANDIADIADSLYYDNLTVKLNNLTSGNSITLTKVNGEDVGLPRDPIGEFAIVPNELYTFETGLLEMETGDDVQLEIEGIFEDRSVSSTVKIIAQPGVSSPRTGTPIQFNEFEREEITFRWGQRAGNINYGVSIYVDVDELNVSSGEVTRKRVEWLLTGLTTETEVTVQTVEFYQFMGSAFDVNEDVLRFIDNITYVVSAGDQILDDINRVSSANLGITSSGEIPNYTNMSDGLGIFASRHTYTVDGLFLDASSRDSLSMGRFTKDLGF